MLGSTYQDRVCAMSYQSVPGEFQSTPRLPDPAISLERGAVQTAYQRKKPLIATAGLGGGMSFRPGVTSRRHGLVRFLRAAAADSAQQALTASSLLPS